MVLIYIYSMMYIVQESCSQLPAITHHRISKECMWTTTHTRARARTLTPLTWSQFSNVSVSWPNGASNCLMSWHVSAPWLQSTSVAWEATWHASNTSSEDIPAGGGEAAWPAVAAAASATTAPSRQHTESTTRGTVSPPEPEHSHAKGCRWPPT